MIQVHLVELGLSLFHLLSAPAADRLVDSSLQDLEINLCILDVTFGAFQLTLLVRLLRILQQLREEFLSVAPAVSRISRAYESFD